MGSPGHEDGRVIQSWAATGPAQATRGWDNGVPLPSRLPVASGRSTGEPLAVEGEKKENAPFVGGRQWRARQRPSRRAFVAVGSGLCGLPERLLQPSQALHGKQHSNSTGWQLVSGAPALPRNRGV